MRQHPLRSVFAILFWLLAWQAVSMAWNYPLLLPSPAQTFGRLFALAGTSAFWRSTAGTLWRMLLGYTCAVLTGALLGVLTAGSPFMETLFRPLRSVIKATPVVSLILLFQLWVRSNLLPAFMAFLMVLPLVWTNVREGILATDPKLLEMASLFRFSRTKKLRSIYLPSVFPQLLAACATGMGFAWKAGVAAEVLARTAHSIGKQLTESKSALETADMFAWTAVVVLFSIVLERLFTRLLTRIRGGARWGGNA